MTVTNSIDTLLGSAYEDVRLVAQNIEAVKHVSANMEAIFNESVNSSNFVSVPSSATAEGNPGQYSADTSYFYICYAINTWRRVAISTW